MFTTRGRDRNNCDGLLARSHEAVVGFLLFRLIREGRTFIRYDLIKSYDRRKTQIKRLIEEIKEELMKERKVTTEMKERMRENEE